MKYVDVGKEFSSSLTNRDEYQRDGKFTGLDFRTKFLNGLDDKEQWENDNVFITLDFGNVKRVGPSWSNEVFAYFTKFGKKEHILKKIKLENISRVKLAIIMKEIETGYNQ
ncbi:MAG: DUF4325 domain-containing protein [Burkholderiales bacterium]|nr:DUF4325 domain-containing protein [Burkholderiales bacterium]MDR4516135.1 STAS-like domain-containing protein [Nitrosomonas sp.]